jgi:single-strand DNA-binding protein
MLTITGNGRLTRPPELRATTSGKSVLNLHVASDRRNRDDGPDYVVLVLWESHAEAAHKHLIKGQAVAFTGRPETRAYVDKNDEPQSVIEVHNVNLEFGAKPRNHGDGTTEPDLTEFAAARDDDTPF